MRTVSVYHSIQWADGSYMIVFAPAALAKTSPVMETPPVPLFESVNCAYSFPIS